MGFASVTCVSLMHRNVEKEINRVRADMHRQRGQKFGPPTPESVEWLNSFTSVIWGIINPAMVRCSLTTCPQLYSIEF
jgi:Ca2+-dependent lipid-binding protein